LPFLKKEAVPVREEKKREKELLHWPSSKGSPSGRKPKPAQRGGERKKELPLSENELPLGY